MKFTVLLPIKDTDNQVLTAVYHLAFYGMKYRSKIMRSDDGVDEVAIQFEVFADDNDANKYRLAEMFFQGNFSHECDDGGLLTFTSALN